MSRHHHPNSVASAAQINFPQRNLDIIACHQAQNRPMTDREIQRIMGFKEIRSVSPCISGLIDAGALHWVDDVICPEYNKVVRRTTLCPKPWIPLKGLVISAKITGTGALVAQARLEQLATMLGTVAAELEPSHNIAVSVREIDGHRRGKNETVYSRPAPSIP